MESNTCPHPSGLPEQHGIYAIRCDPTGDRYVGASIDVRKRAMDHLHHLRAGRHPNGQMQTLFIEHGERAFVFQILEIGCKRLLDRETWWIGELRPSLNRQKEGGEILDCSINIPCTPEFKARLRKDAAAAGVPITRYARMLLEKALDAELVTAK